MGDGEDADAALGAAGAADEVMAAAAVGVGYCGVYDLDEGEHGMVSGRFALVADGERCDESRYRRLIVEAASRKWDEVTGRR